MSEGNLSKDGLLPCPFCGSGETVTDPKTYWTGMRSTIISVEIRHWCKEERSGIRGSSITIRGKTETEARERWNKRS